MPDLNVRTTHFVCAYTTNSNDCQRVLPGSDGSTGEGKTPNNANPGCSPVQMKLDACQLLVSEAFALREFVPLAGLYSPLQLW